MIQDKIADLMDQIRSAPGNQNSRLALIQYLCLAADWDRALKNLGQYQKLFPGDHESAGLFVHNIEAEVRRAHVMAGEMKPMMPAMPTAAEALAQQHLALLALYLDNKVAESRAYGETLLAAQAANPCRISHCQDMSQTMDSEAEWLMDTDGRLAMIWELFIEGKYYWLPLTEIKTVTMFTPQKTTDLLWPLTKVVFKDGREFDGCTPARYPIDQTVTLTNDELMCRHTNWQEMGGLFCGRGQKTLGGSDMDVGLLDIRSIEFASV
ncbi:MAG: hypothetical protein KA214_00840 [Neisseriaceae bacterium]|nr:hypothetical protein [Neisseriaceae bacterium]